MHLDPLTLMVPGAIATAFASLLLLGAWFYNRSGPALLWWSAASGLSAANIGLVTAGFALNTPVPLMIGSGLSLFAPPAIWAGVRRFNHLAAPWYLIVAGPLIWLALLVVPLGIDKDKWSSLVVFGSWLVYLPAAIWTLWQTRAEPLIARWPLMGFLALHALIYAGAAVDTLDDTFDRARPPTPDGWFGMIHFETILFAMGTAIFMVLLGKERRELRVIADANIDPLTGTVTRGAFFETANRLIARCDRDGSPFSLIMFDLDRFKSINDTRGHQVGDRVLSEFAQTVRLSMRPNDLFGRYGGEEFAVALPGASVETARVIAERVRRLFAQDHEFFDGVPLRATVSAGVASRLPGQALETVLGAADRAMYVAKNGGRNRVEIAPDTESDPKLVRIA